MHRIIKKTPLKLVQNVIFIHTGNTNAVDTKYGTGTSVETVNWVTTWKTNVNLTLQVEALIEI